MNDSPITTWSWDLTRPGMLWLLLLLVPVIWYFVRSLSDFPTWQKRVSLVVRSVVLFLLILALAGLMLIKPTGRQYVVLGIDRSLSVDKDAAKVIDQFVEQAKSVAGQNVLAVMDFASYPSPIVPVTESGVETDRTTSADIKPDRLRSSDSGLQ